MEKENIFIATEINISGNIKKIKKMDLEYIITKIKGDMKVNLKTGKKRRRNNNK